MQLFETRSLSYSVLLHLGLVLMAVVALPALLPEPAKPTPTVMSVEILPIGEISNVKPSDKPITEEKRTAAAKISKPVPPTATEKPKEPAPPEDKKPTPLDKAEPLPGEKPKTPEKPKEEAKPKRDDFAALLNKLKQEQVPDKSKDAKDATNTPENKTKSDAPYDASIPLSMSEMDAIKNQVGDNWRMPAGAKDAKNLVVRLRIKMQLDGTVTEVVLSSEQRDRYASDSFFRAAVDSALAAVHKASPFKNLPADKYSTWSAIDMSFTPPDI